MRLDKAAVASEHLLHRGPVGGLLGIVEVEGVLELKIDLDVLDAVGAGCTDGADVECPLLLRLQARAGATFALVQFRRSGPAHQLVGVVGAADGDLVEPVDRVGQRRAVEGGDLPHGQLGAVVGEGEAARLLAPQQAVQR